MEQEIIDTLEHNLIVELRKKEMAPDVRKVLIEDYMKRHKLSLRKLAEEFKIPHTTLYYWTEPQKKAEQSEKQSMDRTDLGKAVSYVKGFLGLVEHHKVKLNDDILKNITTLKEMIDRIYIMTKTIRVD
jgi:hypothetical protein